MVVLAVTVVIHKIPVAYTVGTTFLTKQRPLSHWFTIVFFILFILSTPIGIIIGSSVNSTGGLGIVVIQSIAGGTFIYLATCELIIHEFNTSKDISSNDIRLPEEKTRTQRCINLIKFTFLASGFAIIVILFSLGAKHEH